MKKTILDFLKSPWSTVLLMFFHAVILLICFIYCFTIDACAGSYFDDNGYYTLESSNFPPNYPYWNVGSQPVLSSSVSIPDGYFLAAYSVDVGLSSPSSDNSGTASYFYVQSSSVPFYFYQTGTNLYIGSSSHYLNAFVVENSISSTGEYSFLRTRSAGYYVSGRINRAVSYYPVLDQNGSLIEPENHSLYLSLNAACVDDKMNVTVMTPSDDHYTVDLYLFPSSALINGGAVTNIISSPTYVTEIPASVYHQLENKFLSSVVDTLQESWNYYADLGVIPELKYFSESSEQRINYTFDPTSFDVPYVLLASGNSTLMYNSALGCLLNLTSIANKRTGVYSYDQLALVAVGHFDDHDYVCRLDFSVSGLRGTTAAAPSTITNTSPFISSQVQDINELGSYLRYLFQKQSDDRQIYDSNLLANLQAIPWTNFITGGTFRGLSEWLPQLSDSIDYTFSNLFTDYFIPSAEQMEEVEEDLESERDEFKSKFAFIADIKDEVSFIFETLIRSGDEDRYFEFNLSAYHNVGTVRFSLSDRLPSSVLSVAKNLITCFLSIAVIMHIFKTLPSTIGKMPSGGD